MLTTCPPATALLGAKPRFELAPASRSLSGEQANLWILAAFHGRRKSEHRAAADCVQGCRYHVATRGCSDCKEQPAIAACVQPPKQCRQDR